MAGGKPTRRVWAVMDQMQSHLVYWLSALLLCGAIEWMKGSFEKDPFQTYTFVVLQAPL